MAIARAVTRVTCARGEIYHWRPFRLIGFLGVPASSRLFFSLYGKLGFFYQSVSNGVDALAYDNAQLSFVFRNSVK